MKPLLALAFLASVVCAADLDTSSSELRPLIQRYSADLTSLNRAYPIRFSGTRRARLDRFYAGEQTELGKINFDALSQDGRIDYILFRNLLDYERAQLQLETRRTADVEPLMPFGKTIIALEEARRQMQAVDPQETAATVAAMIQSIEDTQKVESTGLRPRAALANRAAARLTELRKTFKDWFDFYNGYDPSFTWWMSEPYKRADAALESYIKQIKPADNGTVVGDPAGRDALLNDLSYNMIPYTPEELIDLARNELNWCEQEMIKASREMGFGDDWHKALEKVKNDYVEPGKQPELVRKLAQEAVDYVTQRNLVTVPPLAKEDWWEEMLTPEQQLAAPFFLGGDIILVAYPTSTMTQEQKLMSMRGNNVHFARSTVFHELIPGHHLQGFMSARYRTYREPFATPFWSEGNSFYWELLLWDQGFAQTPEDRIGMLFWHMHRAARIIFSLSFHLEKMSAQDCIDFLVDRVGFERDNAAAEVRRSFDGSYPPIYQSAYMLGALQFMALHKELVDSGKMTNRAFHDAILEQNSIPVEMIRAALTKQPLTRDFKTGWRFWEPR
jgi:uncharacterized protein (DUF885 family)